MSNATDSPAQSPRARGRPTLRYRLDTIAAVMLATPAVLLIVMSAWVLASGRAGEVGFVAYVGNVVRVLSLGILVGGSLVLLLAVGLARHERPAEVLGVFLCAAITAICLWFRLLPGEWPVVAGVSAGVTTILLVVALRQTLNPEESRDGMR